LVTFDLPIDLIPLFSKQFLVELNQFQVRFGCSVVVSALKFPEFLVGIVDGNVHLRHDQGNILSEFIVVQFDILEESVSDIDQRIFGPWVEPID
jgi:hypothetical protein